MLKLNEPTREKVCKTEDFPQRKQWLIKMDRVAPVAVNESLWYKLPFTNPLFTTVEPWTSLKSTLLLLTPRAKMPQWKVIRYSPPGSHDKSLCMDICCYSLPQDPQREVAHVQRNSISHRPEPFIWKIRHRNQWSPKLQRARSSCQAVNVIWAIWQNFGSYSHATTFGCCKSSERLKPRWGEITAEPQKNITGTSLNIAFNLLSLRVWLKGGFKGDSFTKSRTRLSLYEVWTRKNLGGGLGNARGCGERRVVWQPGFLFFRISERKILVGRRSMLTVQSLASSAFSPPRLILCNFPNSLGSSSCWMLPTFHAAFIARSHFHFLPFFSFEFPELSRFFFHS